MCKVAFLLIRPIVVFFTVLRRCLRRLALHDFIFCLNKLCMLSRASLLALAKSTYYFTDYFKYQINRINGEGQDIVKLLACSLIKLQF